MNEPHSFCDEARNTSSMEEFGECCGGIREERVGAPPHCFHCPLQKRLECPSPRSVSSRISVVRAASVPEERRVRQDDVGNGSERRWERGARDVQRVHVAGLARVSKVLRGQEREPSVLLDEVGVERSSEEPVGERKAADPCAEIHESARLRATRGRKVCEQQRVHVHPVARSRLPQPELAVEEGGMNGVPVQIRNVRCVRAFHVRCAN